MAIICTQARRALTFILTLATMATAAMLVPPARAQGAADAGPDGTRSRAVVLMYHRFGDERFPSTNIRLDQFKAHIKELTNGHYNVVPLTEIVNAIRANKPLPDHTVAITVDDAYESVYKNGWPLLKAAGLPFTLFVATDAVDRGSSEYMSWDQLRELVKAGVTIGNHTAAHVHLPLLSRAQMKAQFDKAAARFEKELGLRPKLQAYPYGEASNAAMDVARAEGFIASFGQQSGAMSAASNIYYLPRFALNEHFGDLARFKLVVNTLPLYATDVSPADPTLGPNPPPFGFTVGADLPHLAQLACYSSVHGKLEIQRLGERRIELRPPKAFQPGRARINCTLPAGAGRWRWFGWQFYIPKK